ncbi:MAG: PQQ-binding-like beta-propeller repeat protein [Phycisphaerales bacterium]
MPRFAQSLLLATMGMALGIAPSALAQLGAENPVFINDSPAAADSLIQIEQHVALGNLDQAQRQIQKLLDELPQALVPHRDDPDNFRSARSALLALLRGDAELLARYRRAQSAAAEEALARNLYEEVERSWLLTPAGLRAALVLAARQIEAARFDAAFLALQQLDGHPDLLGDDPAPRLAVVALAQTLARYLPRAEALVARFRVGPPTDAAPGPVPHPRTPTPRSPLASLPPGEVKGLVAQPLATTGFAPPEFNTSARASIPEVEDESPFLRELRCMPTLMGDALFIASPKALAAFDRYTLSPRWSARLPDLLGTEPEPTIEDRGYRRRTVFNPSDDLRSVTLGRSLALVAAVSEPQIQAEIREAVAAFDPPTGRLRWVARLEDVSPDLDHAHIRGPIMLDPGGSQAYIVARKDAPERRLRALYLAAFDTANGDTVWHTLVGSVGITPFQAQGSLGDAATLHDGVLYAADRIGLACAYEAATGRPLWVRRLAGEAFDSQIQLAPWQASFPIVDGDRVLILAPDRRTLLILDRHTGRVISQLPVPRAETDPADRANFRGEAFSQVFAYLVRAGDSLAFVSNTMLAIVPAASPASKPEILEFDSSGIKGRVTALGTQFLVPLERSLAIVDTAGKPASTALPLDFSGNCIFADGQLLVADDARLHSYLSWDAANQVLSERITTQPGDAAAGIALAELAYRSSHDDRILTGIDAAKGALELGAGDQHRLHLISSLRTMIDAAQAPSAAAGAAPAPRPPVNPPLVGALIARLEGVSRSPAERAAVHLVRGRHRDDEGDARGAAASYQAVLDDPDLCSVMWQGARIGVRADAEATRRLQDVIARHGREAYGRFDALAAAAIAALPPQAPAEELERLARRFPVALETPSLWGRVADAHEREQRERAAARALEIGLQSAQRLSDVPRAVIADLAGRLVTNLMDRGLAYAADDAYRRARAAFGPLALTRDGLPLDTDQLLARIAAERAEFRRWPAAGLPTTAHVQTLPGWVIMEPVVREPYPNTTSCLALRHPDGRIALFARSGNQDALAEVWSAPAGDDHSQLLRLERTSAVFYRDRGAREGGALTRVDSVSGRELWSTNSFSSYFPAPASPPNPLRGPPGRVPMNVGTDRIATPLEGYRQPNEVIFSSDERTLSMVERSGRALAFDADSGQRLWAAALPLSAVFDTALYRNLLAVAGDAPNPAAPVVAGPGQAGPRVRGSQIVLLDARTGDLFHTIALESTVRWIRFTPSGELVAGLTGSVVSINPDSGALTWTNSQPQCASTIAAWTIDDSIIVQAEDRQAWLLSSGGMLRNSPVDTRERLETVAVPRAIFSQSGDLALATPRGIALISPSGALLGADALGGGQTMLPPLPIRDGFLVFDAEPAQRDRPTPVYNLYKLDARSVMIAATVPIALAEPPSRIAAIDSRFAVSTSAGTIIFAAPPEP